MHFEGRAAR
jgi:hypothetical protein